MGNACDCQLFFAPEEMRKTSLMVKSNKPKDWANNDSNLKSIRILKHRQSLENYLPSDLSPMARVKEPAESIEEKVELYLSCELDSDSYEIQIDTYRVNNGKPSLLSQTEVMKGSNRLEFTKSILVDFVFEAKQNMRFDIMNVKDPSHPQFIGKVETTLSKIVGVGSSTASFDILSPQGSVGLLHVKTEGVKQNLSYIEFEFCLKEIPKMPPGSTLFFKLSRILGEAGYVPIYQSDCIPYSSQPRWQKTRIRLVKLCNSDFMRPIKLQVYTKSGKTDTIVGETTFTLSELINQEGVHLQLKNPIVKKSSGLALFEGLRLEEMPSFLDYIRGGIQIATVVAIDFTQSNGEPYNPSSLHAMNRDGSLNEYQRALRGISDILLDYDSDKRIPMYGFGGIPNFPNLMCDRVNHCFALTGNEAEPYAYGFEGMMETYKNALGHVRLSGPTLFHPVLDAAFKLAARNKSQGSNEYIILVILTDGQINDQERAIQSIIAAANLPISVIIIGVGDEDFEQMRILDGDQGLYDSMGNKASRDIVQFVAFRDFERNQELLAKEVLQEIPTQIVEYYTSVGIKPNPPVNVKGEDDVNKTLMFAPGLLDLGDIVYKDASSEVYTEGESTAMLTGHNDNDRL